MLTAQGAALDLQNSYGRTALMYANHGYEGCAQMLIQAGAALDLQSSNALTALICAACAGHEISLQKVLTAQGAALDLL